MNNSFLLEIATKAALHAGEILRSGFDTAFERHAKSGIHNIVTEYDTRCEEYIVRSLSAATPGASFWAEERGEYFTDSPLTWVIDPLDGTVNFAHSIPIFCVSIGAMVNGSLVAGVIYNPMLDELFCATQNNGATLNGKPIKVSQTSTLAESILVTGFPYNVNTNPKNCLQTFTEIVGRGLPVRRLGSAALDLAYVAAGRFDGFWEVQLQAWDMAAGALIVQEAGGTVTHYNTSDFTLGHNSIIATNSTIHRELQSIIKGVQ